MADYGGVGVVSPPMRVPIAELRRRFGGAAAIDDQEFADRFERIIDLYEIMPLRVWDLFFSSIASGSGGGSGTTGTLYVDLTPADNVVPTLESVDENGTLGVVLDRALTTIDPATYNGVTPADGWKFTIKAFNDATDGRELAFDAAYHGWQTSSGMADAVESYTFTTIAGEFWIDAQEIGVL